VGWVKKWKKRLIEAAPDDLSVLHSRSRARHTPFPAPDPAEVLRIVQIRQAPPENLQRIPGSRTILYYLHRDPDLQAQGLRVPRSARTIWKILRQEGLILDPPAARHRPLPPREPLEEVQIDFKDVTTVPPDPDGKRQHVVETCNFVDAGTPILLEAQVRDVFRAETAFDGVVAFLRGSGLPHMFTFDRDPTLGRQPEWPRFPLGEALVSALFGHPPERSARRISPKSKPTSNVITARTNTSACLCIGLVRCKKPAK
jgi:hypothetical protein